MRSNNYQFVHYLCTKTETKTENINQKISMEIQKIYKGQNKRMAVQSYLGRISH